MPHAPRWRVWIDTGGTFTDCLALDPQGVVHRAKVLSTGALRGRVRRIVDRDRFEVELGVAVPPGILEGGRFLPLGEPGPGVPIRAFDPETGDLLLETALRSAPQARAAFEVSSAEEAPVLAARLVTGTPAGRALPPLDLRLATTRGTNALLERRGAATALFVTRGFADLLEIGTQQRPELFALQVVKPEPLHVAVVEVEERLAADGTVLVPLRLEPLGGPVASLLERGVRSAAVALLHAYRDARHEEAVAAFLRAAGFTHVSTSARLAPFQRLLPRAETAVVDAYLAPVLDAYFAAVAAAVPEGALHVMTSAGGLAGAAGFHAKDALLSGPAGGVVGAAAAGRRSGFARLLAFDMGGTSTDVARWDGEYDYTFEHRVGDAHLVAPALAIESVAAGGGSICELRDGRLRVGPQSAGARPGPACYGAGGPLTLTDVNLLLGRLDPRGFEIPLAPAAAEDALAALLRRIAATGAAARRDEVLLGLVQIADERMAEAMRQVSVRRGYDPGDYALLAFGGAGGQHACAVAGLLGARTVVVPRDAGLLSALGLGEARLERFAERQVLRPLDEVEGELPALVARLEEEAAAAVAAEGIAREAVEVRRRILGLRLAGQDSVLAVEHSAAVPPGAAFAAAYGALYGYPPPARRVEVESVRVVAASRPAEDAPPGPVAEQGEAVAASRRRACVGGAWREVPCFRRERLAPGQRLPSPALVFERHGATLVDAGWAAAVDAAGALVLRREEDG